MTLHLTRSELELIEKSLRFFFCHCNDPKLEEKTGKAFDLSIDFENLLERNEESYYEILAVH